jgi:hypothetical protein
VNLKGGQVPPAVCGNNADPILTGTASGGNGGGFRLKRLLSVAEAKRNIVECCQFEIRKTLRIAANCWFHHSNPCFRLMADHIGRPYGFSALQSRGIEYFPKIKWQTP